MPTCKIHHTRLEVNKVIDFHAILKIVCNRTQEKIIISIQPICLNDSDYDCILEEIGPWDKIGFESDVEVYSNDKEN